MLVLAAVAGFPFLVVLRHVMSCIQYIWRSSCTLGLMADKAPRKAYEAMGVDLWIALLSALSA